MGSDPGPIDSDPPVDSDNEEGPARKLSVSSGFDVEDVVSDNEKYPGTQLPVDNLFDRAQKNERYGGLYAITERSTEFLGTEF